MKHLFTNLVLIWTIGGRIFAASLDLPDRPSTFVRSEQKSLGLFLGRQEDLRECFSDGDILHKRIAESVAAFDLVGLTLGKETGRVESALVPVGKGLIMSAFLREVKLGNWKGGQPQLRIVKRNAILQSPLRIEGETEQPSVSQFLNTLIEPGDVVIACLID
jgi:hypothetical protein